MRSCAQSGTSACTCGTVRFPQIVRNAANLPAIGYRIGDYVAFRHRLLQALPNEVALTAWQPGAEGDLAVQMIEWWAYLGDVLTFYNERIANESYLTTALLPESVNHLVQLLGYRPRPALGSRVELAGLLTRDARLPVIVAQGLQVQSKPGPGQQPQVFELDAQAGLQAPDAVSAIVSPVNQPLRGNDGSIWLSGKVTGIKAGDRVLLVNAAAINAQTLMDYAWINVSGTSQQTDPLGNAVTRVSFAVVSGTLASGAQAADYLLLRGGQSSPLWSYPQPPQVIGNSQADLASVARGLTAGSLVFFDVPDNAGSVAAAAATAAGNALQSAATALVNAPTSIGDASSLAAAATTAGATATFALATVAENLLVIAQANPAEMAQAMSTAILAAAQGNADATTLLGNASALATGGHAAALAAGLAPTPVIVSSYAEVVWYANGNGTTPPASSASNPVVAVTVPHTELTYTGLTGPWWHLIASQVTVRWGWTPVGRLVPVLTAADLTYTGGATPLVPAAGAPSFPATAQQVLIEDSNFNAAAAVASPAATPAGAVTLGQATGLPTAGIGSPMDMLFNLMAFSRGKTVPAEVLGSGNPAVAGQDFRLTKSPVTYFADPVSISGDGFSSTVKVSVNGVQWQEVRSFYGRQPNDQVFVLYEDDAGSTHVTFGDGEHGARLPTGANNVVATYRFGAGAQAPQSETITVVQTPTPGLKGVRNPLPPTGGADADPAAKLSSLAPASVLTFNRAVALDDYAVIAATAPGVTQAVAEYIFDPIAQRPVVALWIAGDGNAVRQAGQALAGIAMPNQGLRIRAATPIESRLSLTYLRDPRYDDATIQAALTAALVDPDLGLLGTVRLTIGQAIYESQISAACLAVPGVTAIHAISFGPVYRFTAFIRRWNGGRLPGYGQPATRAPCSGQRFDPGAGNYFSVPDDGHHLFLNGATAS